MSMSMFYFLRIMKHQFVCYNSSNQELCTPQPNLSAVCCQFTSRQKDIFLKRNNLLRMKTKPVELCARFV